MRRIAIRSRCIQILLITSLLTYLTYAKDTTSKEVVVNTGYRNYFDLMLEDLLTPEVVHYIRPVYKYGQMSAIGFTKGLFHLDLRNPMFCFYDAW